MQLGRSPFCNCLRVRIIKWRIDGEARLWMSPLYVWIPWRDQHVFLKSVFVVFGLWSFTHHCRYRAASNSLKIQKALCDEPKWDSLKKYSKCEKSGPPNGWPCRRKQVVRTAHCNSGLRGFSRVIDLCLEIRTRDLQLAVSRPKIYSRVQVQCSRADLPEREPMFQLGAKYYF